MIPLWLDYMTALRTVHIGLDYSIGEPSPGARADRGVAGTVAGDRWRSERPCQRGAGTGDGDRPPSHESQTTAPQTRPSRPSRRSRAAADRQQRPDLRRRRHGRQQVEREDDPNAMPSQRTRASGMSSIRNTSAPYA